MKIYAYYESVPGYRHEGGIQRAWRNSWAMYGWTPIMLGIEEAQKHRLFNDVTAHVKQLPSVNVESYELACYYRWLALAAVGGGWLADYDVINYGLKPRVCGRDIAIFTRGHYVPCLTWATHAGAERIVRMILEYQAQGATHCSDQMMFERLANIGTDFGDEILCAELGERISPQLHWKNTPTVHFASGAVGTFFGAWIPKHRAVATCGRV